MAATRSRPGSTPRTRRTGSCRRPDASSRSAGPATLPRSGRSASPGSASTPGSRPATRSAGGSTRCSRRSSRTGRIGRRRSGRLADALDGRRSSGCRRTSRSCGGSSGSPSWSTPRHGRRRSRPIPTPSRRRREPASTDAAGRSRPGCSPAARPRRVGRGVAAQRRASGPSRRGRRGEPAAAHESTFQDAGSPSTRRMPRSRPRRRRPASSPVEGRSVAFRLQPPPDLAAGAARTRLGRGRRTRRGGPRPDAGARRSASTSAHGDDVRPATASRRSRR